MEMGVGTVATQAPQFPVTNASHGMNSPPMNTSTSAGKFTRTLKIAVIFAAIQEGSV